MSSSLPSSSPSIDPSSVLDDDEAGLFGDLISDSDLDHESPYRRPSSFDSEVDAQIDYEPESSSDSDDSVPHSRDPGSSQSRDSSAEGLFENGDFYPRPDSYPLSPDLEGELELALLAEIDDRVPPLAGLRVQPPGVHDGNMAGRAQDGAAVRRIPGGDVLVDLELYFRQDRAQRRSQNRQGPADVIDLTNEPDSPVQHHAPRPVMNPRRQNSQARNPPALARSDSSILAGGAPVIDLTDDSPELPRHRRPNPPPQPPARNQGGFMFNHPSGAISGLAAGIRRHLYPLRLFPTPDEDVQLLGFLHHNRINQADFNNPLGNINLQYEHGAFDRAESPKPAHQAPPPAKPGFTRDTASDLVVVCPACNEELAYDPEAPPAESTTRKGKRKRSSENHFFALKSCGHVYCEDCHERRRPGTKRPNTGFPRDPDGKIVCAVDGCDTQATNKLAWVPIYL
ncbi:hypothetical protein CMUS01_02169 [Colletotrichum musicola]|uniref:Cell cycle control protein n=1 Tax=Colletotrichum musicola TaxID=2175873 RepID=A0A8H6NVR6_9PEZI|nr:hypothetical protein CMUS01_02169 [Colletotrichum musicola]